MQPHTLSNDNSVVASKLPPSGDELLNLKARAQHAESLPVGGRLTHFWKKWVELGDPRLVILWL